MLVRRSRGTNTPPSYDNEDFPSLPLFRDCYVDFLHIGYVVAFLKTFSNHHLPFLWLTCALRGEIGFPIDSIEDSSTLTIKADLAGVDKKDISVTHAKNSITIRASRPCFEGNKRDYNLWLERPCGNLERVIRLAEPIDEASMQASLKEGVLTVKATKHYTASPSKVEIQ